jgi:hypothetical protein
MAQDNDDETGFETSAELRRAEEQKTADEYVPAPTETAPPAPYGAETLGRRRTMLVVGLVTLLILLGLVVYFVLR